MNDRELTRHLLAAVVAGLAALSVASTCPHQAATNERESHWDCRSCTGNPEDPWQPIPDGANCKGYKHDWIMAWCKCHPDAKCVPTGTLYVNQSWDETEVGTCYNGYCSVNTYSLTAQGTLEAHVTQGCAGS